MAKKRAKKTDQEKLDKGDIEGFRGGCNLPLDRIMSDGRTLRTALSQHVGEILDLELKNHAGVLDNIGKWQRQYEGKKKTKNTPFPNCFSKDTDILTLDGWKNIADLRKGDFVLSLNPDSGCSYYYPVAQTIELFEHELLSLKSKSIDLCVTPGHSFLVYDRKNRRPKFVQANKLKNGWKIPLTSTHITGERTDFLYGYPAEKVAQFIGWYIAEGWTYCSGTIGIAQSEVNGHHRDEIEGLLGSLGWKYKKRTNGFLVSARSVPKELRRVLKNLGKSYNKYIPRQLQMLNRQLLRLMLDTMIKGDGHTREDGETTYFTTSKQLADDVQEIAQKIGLRATIKIENYIGRPVKTIKKFITPGFTRQLLYRVSILRREWLKTDNIIVKPILYDDFVYCPTVYPHHTVYVRRNGIACWSGQCSNVAIPITRSDADAILVRLMDAIFNKRKVWIFRAKLPELVGLDRELEEFFDWFQRNVLQLKKKMKSPLRQMVKIGTGFVKIPWVEKRRSIYRYATPEEVGDKNTTKYALQGTDDKAIKETETIYIGPDVQPISREDMIYSSDATDLQSAYLTGFKFTLRKPQLDLKVRQGIYDEEAASKLKADLKPDQAKEARAENVGLEVRKSTYEEPYELWNLYLKYDVDEDGEEDDIELVFHKESGEILKSIYNPIFYGFRPLLAIRGIDREFSVEGEGICQILEKLQEAIDTIVNQRIDRLHQINAPITIVQSGSGLDEFTLEPGKVWVSDQDPATAVNVVTFPDVYPSTEREEARLVSYADRAVGITPSALGMSTAERPVAKETIVLAEEANKKFKDIIENVRDFFRELGYMLVEFFAQYQPVYQYQIPGQENGQLQEKTMRFPTQHIRDGLDIELFASTELMSQEIRREINLTVYTLLSDFKTKMAGMVQAIVSPMTPPPFVSWLISEYKSGNLLMKRIIQDFDIPDADELLTDIDNVIQQLQMLQQQMAMRPPMGPPGQGGPPQGGPPGMSPGMSPMMGGPQMRPPGM